MNIYQTLQNAVNSVGGNVEAYFFDKEREAKETEKCPGCGHDTPTQDIKSTGVCWNCARWGEIL